MSLYWTEELKDLIKQRETAFKIIKKEPGGQFKAAAKFLKHQLASPKSFTDEAQKRIIYRWREKIIAILPSEKGGHAAIRTKWIERIQSHAQLSLYN